jgi:hypothetical protein
MAALSVLFQFANGHSAEPALARQGRALQVGWAHWRRQMPVADRTSPASPWPQPGGHWRQLPARLGLGGPGPGPRWHRDRGSRRRGGAGHRASVAPSLEDPPPAGPARSALARGISRRPQPRTHRGQGQPDSSGGYIARLQVTCRLSSDKAGAQERMVLTFAASRRLLKIRVSRALWETDAGKSGCRL